MYRRLLACVLAALAAAVLSAPAHAEAATEASIEISIFPAGFYGGPSTTTSAIHGYYTAGPSLPIPQKIVVRRGGVVVYDSLATTPDPPGVQPGDVVQVLHASSGAVLAETSYAGPSIDGTSCVGQRTFSGRRATNAAIAISTVRPTLVFNNYGGGITASEQQLGYIQSLGAGTFAGIFERPVLAGDYFAVVQVISQIAGDHTSTFRTKVITQAGTCPPPTDTTAVPTPVATALKLTALRLGATRRKVAGFLRRGWSTSVGVSKPSTISALLVLDNGAKLPTVATSAKAKKKKAKKAVTLGRGKVSAKRAGVVKLTIKPVSSAAKALKGRRSSRVVLLITARDAGGHATTTRRRATLVR